MNHKYLCKGKIFKYLCEGKVFKYLCKGKVLFESQVFVCVKVKSSSIYVKVKSCLNHKYLCKGKVFKYLCEGKVLLTSHVFISPKLNNKLVQMSYHVIACDNFDYSVQSKHGKVSLLDCSCYS